MRTNAATTATSRRRQTTTESAPVDRTERETIIREAQKRADERDANMPAEERAAVEAKRAQWRAAAKASRDRKRAAKAGEPTPERLAEIEAHEAAEVTVVAEPEQTPIVAAEDENQAPPAPATKVTKAKAPKATKAPKVAKVKVAKTPKPKATPAEKAPKARGSVLGTNLIMGHDPADVAIWLGANGATPIQVVAAYKALGVDMHRLAERKAKWLAGRGLNATEHGVTVPTFTQEEQAELLVLAAR